MSKTRLLYSRYMDRFLYDSSRGYFSTQQRNQLGKLPSLIDFRSLKGLGDYRAALEEKYPDGRFLTPSEIFRPFYGMSMAQFFLEWSRGTGGTRVVEAGPGMGGQANAFLLFLKTSYPEIYRSISYTLVDVSPFLSRRCREVLSESHAALIERGNIKFVVSDIEGFLRNSSPFGERTLLMMFEVLDNMPHDRVEFGPGFSDPCVTLVESDPDFSHRELVLEPLKDHPAVSEVFEAWKEYFHSQPIFKNKLNPFEDLFPALRRAAHRVQNLGRSPRSAVYLPTHFHSFLRAASRHPNLSHLMSDFSWLPGDVRYSGRFEENNAPIISTKVEGQKKFVDFASVCEPEFGTADIFFGTDFEFAQFLIKKALKVSSLSLSPREFFDRFAQHEWGLTKSSFNPMKADFSNTQYLFTKITK